MSLVKLGDVGVDWLDLERPYSGTWLARARLDIGADAPPALGPGTLTFDTGAVSMSYVGTIIESYSDEGDGWIVMVGGTGGLRRVLLGEDYERPPPRVVVAAILAGAGEVAGDLFGLSTLARIEPFYSRLAGLASRQLDAVCAIVGARWSVRPDGAVDVGPAAWPAYASDPFIVRRPNAAGIIDAEPELPDIEPGSIADGYRVAHVRYFVTEDGLSAKLGLEPS